MMKMKSLLKREKRVTSLGSQKGDHQHGRRGGARPPREDFFETPSEVIDIMMEYIAEYDNGRISSEFVILTLAVETKPLEIKFYLHTIYLYRTRLYLYRR